LTAVGRRKKKSGGGAAKANEKAKRGGRAK